ncbi:hypothetical protein [Pigmentiphaga sp. D-2]|uniref:hypothetical protein n=1 Tax=Pigmentiphaga sp. D-2 TaxID=1002116 RepID=UPI001052EA3C|nr:hypothetical protein [Pigmentiphaga sp. D-2]
MTCFTCGNTHENRKRDVLRAKSGVADDCVIGEIAIQVLRQFQISRGFPNKPVPDAFKIDLCRKLLRPGVGND